MTYLYRLAMPPPPSPTGPTEEVVVLARCENSDRWNKDEWGDFRDRVERFVGSGYVYEEEELKDIEIEEDFCILERYTP